MKDYKRVIIDCLWISVALVIWFLYIHRNSSINIEVAEDMLGWTSITIGYNYIMLHCSLYLIMALIILRHLQPAMNEQIFTRMPRFEIIKEQMKALLQAIVIFIAVFQTVFLLMLLYFCGAETLAEYSFYLAYGLYTVRLIVVYTLFGMLFLLLKVMLWKSERALFGTVAIIGLWNKFGEKSEFASIVEDLAVYDKYFSKSGLDMMEYIFVTIKYITAILIMTYVILKIFERRDILYDKK